MKTLISCAYNMDNCCVEVKFSDGSMIAIDTIAVENEIADNMYQRSELDYLIYNAPLEYADLILNGDPETYLKTVTEYLYIRKPWPESFRKVLRVHNRIPAPGIFRSGRIGG